MDITIICACKNRKAPLLVALASWLQYDEIKEIIITDWTSDQDQRLDDLVVIDERIKIIRVDNERYFNLTQPLNLAAKLATGDYILKVDCDYVLNPYNNFFKKYPVDKNSFVSGHHELANPEIIDERTGLPGVDLTKTNIFEIRDYVNSYSDYFKYLRGLLLVSKENFDKIGGYNEEFDTYYAFDDDNICARLELLGLTHKKLDYDHSWIHLPHSDTDRLENFRGYHETGQKDQLESLDDGEHKWNTAYYIAQSHINKNKELYGGIKTPYAMPKINWRIVEFGERKYIAFKEPSDKLKGFPVTICLSLDESEDRRSAIKKQFNDLGIRVEFLISSRFEDGSYRTTGKYEGSLNSGTKGCAISHIQAMKLSKDINVDYILICEDDLSLETIQYWNFTWKDFLQSLPNDWDVIQLLIIKDQFNNFNLKDREWNEWGASAYLIKCDYAEKLYKHYGRLQAHNVYNLEVLGNPDLQPLVENLIFVPGKTYSIPLFVENIEFGSTFIGNDDDVVDGQKNSHIVARDVVLNYWKAKVESNIKNDKNGLEIAILNYSVDVENANLNFKVGLEYEKQGHNAPALSYFLRAAERASDDLLAYEALIHASNCYDRQGTRDGTAKAILQQAMVTIPERPEARYLLAKFSEKKEWWQDCYIYANEALKICDFDIPSLNGVEYKKDGLLFLKGVAAWWWGKTEESLSIMKHLINSSDVDIDIKNLANNNLKFIEEKIK